MTLIEVLVVIVMIAIAVALFLPALSTGGPGFASRCRSNERQLGIAAVMYSDDSKGRFPNLDTTPGNDGPVALSLLTSYVHGQTNLFICPFVARRRESERPWYRSPFVPALNRQFFHSNGNDYAYYDGVPSATSNYAIIADRFAWTNRAFIKSNLLNHPKGAIYVGFGDGHVEMLPVRTVVGTNLTPSWSARQDPIRRL
jgi:prepilin-type processing-associated H-X9-DG protein